MAIFFSDLYLMRPIRHAKLSGFTTPIRVCDSSFPTRGRAAVVGSLIEVTSACQTPSDQVEAVDILYSFDPGARAYGKTRARGRC
jgi:hypothetical protein